MSDRNAAMPAAPGLRWNRQTKLVCAVVATVAYFLAAYWLKVSYVPPFISNVVPKVAGEKFLLRRPFVSFLGSDFGVIATDNLFGSLADSASSNYRSTIEIYEDDKLLGPPHSKHEDIAVIGRGRFSHWSNGGGIFVFSSSDNSDPQTNGRAYWAVRPDIPNPPPEP